MLQIFGGITPPPPFQNLPGQYGGLITQKGLINFLNNIIRLLIAVGGIWAFLNLVLAGYSFLSAGDDPKNMEKAWAKIWQSMMGLLFILGSFILGGVFSYLLFGNPTTIFNPKVYGP